MVAVMLFPFGGPKQRLAYPRVSDNIAAQLQLRFIMFIASAAQLRFNLLTSPAKRANAAGISESAVTSAPMQMRANL
ncbi:hypothetical protein [Sphingopyxis sp. YR583]|uniref:hypothetical protein n=1 Tax=Sphingopyxis sp. YR583 TaxID=1881047 RepID=UPI0015A671BB|nr:hypothetical protein [Sphingopyxis sp. YR583]